jgi:multicomponent Na+:H+ antiporter subunit D
MLRTACFDAPEAGAGPPAARWEGHPLLLSPLLFTALMSVLVGLLAHFVFSPLSWAQLISERKFRP